MRAKRFRVVVAVVGLAVGAANLATAGAADAATPVGRAARNVNRAPDTAVLTAGENALGRVVVTGRAADDRGVTKVKVTVKDRSTGRYWNPATGRWQTTWLWYNATLGRPRSARTGWNFRFDPRGTGGSGRYQVAAVAWDDQGRRDPAVTRRRFEVTPPPSEEPPVDEPVVEDRTLVWADEFNGSDLDPTHWKTFSGLYNTPYCVQDYTARDRNVRVEGGSLHLEAHREASNGQRYTSGMVVSNDVREAANSVHRGNTAWTHGRFEMRAKLPDAPGLWPAFWMRPEKGVYGGWPRSGEIDILEYAGPNTHSWSNRRIVHDLHWWSDTAPGNNGSVPANVVVTDAWLDRFHTFAVEWDATGFRWYVDGQLTHQAGSGWSAPGGAPGAPFDQDFFITLNLQVGGWAGPVDDTALATAGAFQIDWVRVYQ